MNRRPCLFRRERKGKEEEEGEKREKREKRREKRTEVTRETSEKQRPATRQERSHFGQAGRQVGRGPLGGSPVFCLRRSDNTSTCPSLRVFHMLHSGIAPTRCRLTDEICLSLISCLLPSRYDHLAVQLSVPSVALSSINVPGTD